MVVELHLQSGVVRGEFLGNWNPVPVGVVTKLFLLQMLPFPPLEISVWTTVN